MESIGKKIKDLRIHYGMTQDDVADSFQMSRTTFSKYENGAANPPLSVLRKLSALFNVSIEYLIHDDVEPLTFNSDSSDEQADLDDALRGFVDLTPEEKSLILKLRLKDKKTVNRVKKLVEKDDE